MAIITVLRKALHIAVLALNVGVFLALVPLTHDALVFTLMFFTCTIMFQAFFTEVDGAEEAGDTCDCMEMVVVDVVDVDAGSLVGTRAGDEFVAESGADDHDSYSQHVFEGLHIL